MDIADFSLELGRNWIRQARLDHPDSYRERAWELYCQSPEEPIYLAALLSELALELRQTALELRSQSSLALQTPAEDLLRAGMLAFEVALTGLRGEDWGYVEERAQAMAVEAMQQRLSRPE